MNDTFQVDLRLRAEHVDPRRNLRLSTLLLFSQEMCIHHTELLGMGRVMTLDKGLLWIIDKQVLEVNRLPAYDEEITLLTYPGTTLHFFFPRYFKILDKEGNNLVKGTSLWSLINSTTRKIISPEEHGIIIHGREEGDELPCIFLTKAPEKNRTLSWKADYTHCDLNGHLNNASYIDFAQDALDNDYLLSHDIQRMEFAFKKEIRLGETIPVDYISQNEDHYFTSPHFFIHLKYR